MIDENSLDRPGIVAAAAATGTAAVIVFALLPVLSGALADHFKLDDVETGLVATSYFSVYALIALTSAAWIRRFDWVKTARVGFGIMVLGLIITLLASSFTMSSVGLSMVGAGAGLLFPISLTLVSDMERTDRAYAIKMCVEQLVPASLLFLLSSSLFAGFGLRTTLVALLGVVVACFFVSRQLPAHGNEAKHIAGEANGKPHLGIASLVGLGLGFAGFAGLWAFLERIAVDNQFEAGFTTTWLAVGLITSGIGPLGGAILEDRVGRTLPLIVATLVAVATLFLLGETTSKTAFAIVLTLLPLSYYFSLCYAFSVVAEADHNGKIAGLMSFSLAIGAGAGPALFGWIKATDGPVVLVMGLLILSGSTLIIWIQTRLTQVSHGAST